MWGYSGVAGLLSVIFTGVWFFAYFRSQFGPFSNEDKWYFGLWNIRCHQLLVLSAGSMLAFSLGKLLAICLQFAYLTARMGRMSRRVEALAQRTKDRQYYWTTRVLDMMTSDKARSESFCEAGLVPGPRRVLIFQASVGAGHKRAAEAIEAALLREDPSINVRTVDVMDPKFADRVFKYFYKDWYLALCSGQSVFGSAGNPLVGFFFDKANVVTKGTLTGGGFLNNRRLCMTMILNVLDFLCDFEPDVIVHTHFLSAEIIAGLRRHDTYTCPQVTAITDMDVHAWWYQQPCEKYFVPRALAQTQLELYGVPPKDIMNAGVPIMPAFAQALDAVKDLSLAQKRDRFRSQMDATVNLWDSPEDNRPIILIMSGGPSVRTLFEHTTFLQTPSIIVVVCGREADLRAELDELNVPLQHKVCLLGFTKTMHELMAISDVIITKPGGLITSEALACGLMIVVVDPYAGQEERNAAMLLEEGAAIQVHHHELIPFRLDPIIANPAILQRYRMNAARLGKPDAARQIAKCILEEKLAEASANTDLGGLELSPGARLRVVSTDGLVEMTRIRSDSTATDAGPLQWFEKRPSFQARGNLEARPSFALFQPDSVRATPLRKRPADPLLRIQDDIDLE